jgi:DUF971 family protein
LFGIKFLDTPLTPEKRGIKPWAYLKRGIKPWAYLKRGIKPWAYLKKGIKPWAYLKRGINSGLIPLFSGVRGVSRKRENQGENLCFH